MDNGTRTGVVGNEPEHKGDRRDGGEEGGTWVSFEDGGLDRQGRRRPGGRVTRVGCPFG